MKTSQMEQEAKEAAHAVTRQLTENISIYQALKSRLQQSPPPFAMTIARGSSDHACIYAKYLLETYCGWITASAAPSTVTLYHAPLNLKNALVLGISQSGKSPDICQTMQLAKQKGAVTVAIVNNTNSPLAEIAEFVIPMQAGEETAVAATKSYIASLSILAHCTAIFSDNQALQQAIPVLPDRLHAASEMDWSTAIPLLQPIHDTLVLARGFGFSIAHEAALKFKETANIHAEAFSGAELLHGPIAILQPNMPYLCFLQDDPSLPGMLQLLQKMKDLNTYPLVAMAADHAETHDLKDLAHTVLPLPHALHPACDPILTIQAFYPMMAQLSQMRGLDPDHPEKLKKVTETI